jgi:pyruvate dehydrogenase E1 component
VTEVLEGLETPIVAATDYMKALPDLIRPWVRQRFVSLGTDGFGRSDTREALRRFFEVDAESIALAALHALAEEGRIEAAEAARAVADLGLDPDKSDPLSS